MSDPSTLTLATAIAGWLDDARFRALSPRTIAEYGRVATALAAFATGRLGRAPTLTDLEPALVRAWMAARPRPLADPVTWKRATTGSGPKRQRGDWA